MPARWPTSCTVTDVRQLPIIVPAISAADADVRLGQWLVEEGEYVLQGDRIVELLTDGVLFQLSSPAEGSVRRTLISEGGRVAAGDCLGYILTSPPAEG